LNGSANGSNPTRPRVTIVTPVLNGARFVGGAVESVLAQSYPGVEYVVVDGGSRDGTLETLQRYGDRVRVLVREGAGQAEALNIGFAEAAGEVLGFLNADDLYLPDAIAAAVDALDAHPEASFVYGEADHIDESGDVLGPYPTEAFAPDALARRCIVCQPAAFFRADAFRQIGGVDPALHYALDYDLWIRLSRVGAPVAFARKIALSRMHPANKTLGSRRAAYEETMKVLKRHYDYVPYDWVVAHANHVADRRDGFFQESRASRLNVLASLAVGLFINSKQWGRYLRDWLAHRRFRTNRN